MKKQYLSVAVLTMTSFLVLGADSAFASAGFTGIVTSVKASVSNLPLLLSVVCYIAGIAFVLFSLFRIKVHVESPSNMPLKNALAMLFIGGALLAAPTVVEAARSSIDRGTAGDVSGLYKNLKSGIGGL